MAMKPSAYSKEGFVHGSFFTNVGVLGLVLACPPTIIYMWYIIAHLDGSLSSFITMCWKEGLGSVLAVWPQPSGMAWKLIGSFASFEALLLLAMPGKEFIGPVSPAGNRPVYKCNGVQCFITTMLVYLGIWKLGWFNPALVYDHLGEIFSALNVSSFIFCFLLYAKGHLAPSSSDWGSSGNILFDFFWGMELYPRIGKNFDIKTFTNCRFGMMGWAVLILSYAIKQYEMQGFIADSMLVSVSLMLIYIAKFFYWESGYWSTMDIMHDRAGFYLCWGCLAWLPCVYTSPAMYLVQHPNLLGVELAICVFILGVVCIFVNYDSDRQRQQFRSTGGKCLIWGKPCVKIEAQYVTEDGATKTSLLLASGWWGLSRHFHYVPEILAAFCWSLPALFDNFLPYFYVTYLTILLMDRAARDDKRCHAKYKKFWDMYREKVPYKVIPGVY